MNNNTKPRTYSIIAAILFIFLYLYQLYIAYLDFSYIDSLNKSLKDSLYFLSEHTIEHMNSIWFKLYCIKSDLIFAVIILAFAIILFIGKKNASLIVASSVMILYNIFYLIYSLIGILADGDGFNVLYLSVFGTLEYASLTIIIILGIINNDIVRKIFFIPSIIKLIEYIFGNFFTYEGGKIYEMSLHNVLYTALYTASLFFLGFWIYKSIVPNSKSTVNHSLIGSADKLKKYKELLDAGVITQKEFEEKKKQLFNLK